ncbi:hypothetical protein RF55_17637 [Lasius niger]|uniref:Uncharacterized protein n=1 Tax=Lasius niger TaxID=67767 RepID=A0A0J7MVJ6_LASNI|nr:hypothetical protein RF55_17637 [Lasius niger]
MALALATGSTRRFELFKEHGAREQQQQQQQQQLKATAAMSGRGNRGGDGREEGKGFSSSSSSADESCEMLSRRSLEKHLKFMEARTDLRIAKGQVEEANRRMESLRLRIEEMRADREEELRAELRYQLREEERRLTYLMYHVSAAEEKVEELRWGVDP